MIYPDIGNTIQAFSYRPAKTASGLETAQGRQAIHRRRGGGSRDEEDAGGGNWR
jgi:hypothetical protein